MIEGGDDYPALTGLGARRLADAGWRIVVVGAGGWLGLATLESLWELLGDDMAGRVVCFGSRARLLRLRRGRQMQQQPLSAIGDLAAAPSLVLHNAFLTQEKAKEMSPHAYAAANRAISDHVLSVLDRIGAEGVFAPSSGAVYMADQPDAEDSKRSYGRLKLDDEARFADWADRRGRRATIARIFNLSGPYINKRSSYALSCFIADALADRPISIRATHRVFRSYVAISELMSVVLGDLAAGGAGAITFDTAGEVVYEMGQIAEIVRDVVGRGEGVDRPALRDSAPDYYVGDGAVYTKLRDALHVEAVPFPVQVRETVKFMLQDS
jgi:nucleoside-diphosphate-sugar epimerase